MIKEGDIIYYEEQGELKKGKVKNLTEETFEIEGYGCCCEGYCVINRSMIGYTFFTNKEELEKRIELLKE